jgi:hypothetical protein
MKLGPKTSLNLQLTDFCPSDQPLLNEDSPFAGTSCWALALPAIHKRSAV